MAPSFEDGNSLFDFVVKNGNGVKGLVDSGIEKVPERYIQPEHERIDKLKATFLNVSPIDLSKLDGPENDRVAEAIARAAESLGFFQVVNHGVPLELLDSLKDAAHKFFSQPPEKKAVYLKGVSPSPLVKYGTSFAPEKEKTLEWKDYIIMMYNNDADALQHWPNVCKEVALEYLKLSTKLVRRLLEVLLGKLGVTLDDSRLEALTGNRMVSMNYYPVCPNPELTVGVGRHSDIGLLTVLLQDDIGGLYVKLEERLQKEAWVEIPPIPGALVVNVGDSLQILSNDRFRSAEHRVRTTSKESRVSIPSFPLPKPTEKIGPLPQLVERDGIARYKELLFQDYQKNFIESAHEGKHCLDFARNDAS